MEDRGRSRRGCYRRMKRYFNDFWNVVDLLSYVLLIAALFVRHFRPSEKFTVARRVFSLSLLVMYLRFLEVFLIHRKLGPTLIMIKEMVKNIVQPYLCCYHEHATVIILLQISSQNDYRLKMHRSKTKVRYILAFFF